MNTILTIGKFVLLFLFIVGFSYIISHSYPTFNHHSEVNGFTSIVSAQAERNNMYSGKDTEIVRLLIPDKNFK